MGSKKAVFKSCLCISFSPFISTAVINDRSTSKGIQVPKKPNGIFSSQQKCLISKNGLIIFSSPVNVPPTALKKGAADHIHIRKEPDRQTPAKLGRINKMPLKARFLFKDKSSFSSLIVWRK